MPKRILLTTHRPTAGQELGHFFLEQNYEVHATSLRGAWPVNTAGEPDRTAFEKVAPGVICHILDQPRIEDLVKLLREIEPRAIVHSPLQGLRSSDSQIETYQSVVNGTLQWLAAAREACPTIPFIHISSTMVYGDRANTIEISEETTRLDYANPVYGNGITQSFPIEQSTHSLPGAAAVAADVLVQEFSRSYFLPACCLRVDSLCDPGNGREDRRDLLSLITQACLTGAEYVIQGKGGKQVREITAARDIAAFCEAFIQQPNSGEIYNVGGGKTFTCSVLEAIQWIESLTGKSLRTDLSASPPLGEPFCYYSDPRHVRYHYPKWKPAESWKKTAQRVVEAQQARLKS